MAIARSRKPIRDDVGLGTFVVEDIPPGATPFAGLRGTRPFARPGSAAPAGKPTQEPGLALGQMRLAIEDNLLMVFGPEGDPVPPQAFAAAAAAHRDAPLALPDGTTAPASRIADVLRAQVLGRLGRRPKGSQWILAMLREGGGPEPASEDELRAEQDAPGAIGAVESQLTILADGGGIAAGAPPGGADQTPPRDREPTTAAEADAAPATPHDERAPAEPAAATVEPSHGAAMPWLERGREEAAPHDLPDPAPSVQAVAEEDAEAVAERTEVDLDNIVPMAAAGLPDGARLGTGVPDQDGGWSSSSRDRSTVTITPRAGTGPGSRQDRSRAPDGSADPRGQSAPAASAAQRGKGDARLVQDGEAGAADKAASPAGPRTVALGLSPQALAGEGFLALVVRDVPAGARLSAGAYDPALDGWLIRPQDLATLTLSAPPEVRGDFTVTLIGIALRPGDANAVRILAWLPVRVA